MFVSMLHMVFDVLAFKNDIQFWRKKKNMEGMSVQSLGVNCFFQVSRSILARLAYRVPINCILNQTVEIIFLIDIFS